MPKGRRKNWTTGDAKPFTKGPSRPFRVRLPEDVARRLRSIARRYDAKLGTLISAIVCQWAGAHAPWYVRPPGKIPWYAKRQPRHDPDMTDDHATKFKSPCRERRRRLGVSIARLAIYAGVAESSVRRLEHGGATLGQVRLRDIIRIADALGCAPLELVPGMALSARAYRKKVALVRPGEDPMAQGALLPPTHSGRALADPHGQLGYQRSSIE